MEPTKGSRFGTMTQRGGNIYIKYQIPIPIPMQHDDLYGVVRLEKKVAWR